MRVAVVGHVEWAEFARVERMPAAGEIVHAHECWEAPAGGGAVAAVELARLAGEALFLTALGDDPLGRRAVSALEARGVRVAPVFRREPQRRVFVHVDAGGERTITVLGPRLLPRGDDPLPWSELARCDAVFLTAGDAAAVRAARAARVLTSTPRTLATLVEAAVPIDALIGSGHDAGERVPSGALAPSPALLVQTEGAEGGHWRAADGRRGRWVAAPLPSAGGDAYGAGDAFAAGLTFALGGRLELDAALAAAARSGAAARASRAPFTELAQRP